MARIPKLTRDKENYSVGYIAELCADLSTMCRQDGHQLLAYLLSMAALEANNIIQLREQQEFRVTPSIRHLFNVGGEAND